MKRSQPCLGVPLSIVLLLATAGADASAATPESTSTRWVISCDIPQCTQTYPEALTLIEAEMNSIIDWLREQGFTAPRLADASGTGTDGRPAKGPVLRLKYPEGMGPSDHDTIASYHVSTHEIWFNVGKKESRLQALLRYSNQRIDPADYPAGLPINEPVGIALVAYQTLAHELYHAVQAAEGDVNGDVCWIGEGTADAVGGAYTRERFGSIALWPLYFDQSLTASRSSSTDCSDGPEDAYDRAFFFYRAAEFLGRPKDVSYLTDLFAQVDRPGKYAVAWIDSFLQDRGKALHPLYHEMIARYGQRKAFEKPQKPLSVSQPGQREAASTLLPWSTHGRDVHLLPEAFQLPEPNRRRAYLPLAFVEIPSGGAPEHSRLLLDEDLLNDRRAHWLTDPQSLPPAGVRFFSKVTNMPAQDHDTARREKVTLRAGVQRVRVSLPYCIAPGDSTTLRVSGLPDDYPLELSATFGQLDPVTLEYRASPDHSEDELHATVYDASGGTFDVTKDIIFARFRLGQSCSFRLTSADGYSLTIDPRTKTTLAKDPSRKTVAYFDRDFVYVNDRSLGGWVKFDKGIMKRFAAQMVARTGALLAGAPPFLLEPLSDAAGRVLAASLGPDPHSWGRAPYDFLRDLERAPLGELAERHPATIVASQPVCPARAPNCSGFTISGRDTVVYDRNDDIVELRLRDGQRHGIEQVAVTVRAPSGARRMKF